jgi:NAD(P)H-dependent FMN reductase
MIDMYSVVIGTNRENSNSLKVGKFYLAELGKQGISAQLFTLEGLEMDNKSQSFKDFEANALIPTLKFIFILPEYNGSYPGVFKHMIDISDIKKCWPTKKALLTGVATGKGGNIRGLEHVTGALNYLKVFVHPNRLPISQVDLLLDSNGQISDEKTILDIRTQLSEFINF